MVLAGAWRAHAPGDGSGDAALRREQPCRADARSGEGLVRTDKGALVKSARSVRNAARHGARRQGAAAQENAVKELIPTGSFALVLRFASADVALFVVKEADGIPRGITADLGQRTGEETRRSG